MRSSDLDDIYHIITVFHDLSFDEIVVQHSELLLNEPYDDKLIAARMLGRKMAPILRKSKALHQRIYQVLSEQMKPSHSIRNCRTVGAKPPALCRVCQAAIR